LIEKDKTIVASELGRQLHDALPAFAVRPDLTALWHEQQKRIEAGDLDYKKLIASVDETIASEVCRIQVEGLAIKTDAPPCPVCGKGHLRQRQGKNGPFWSCATYPTCRASYPDHAGSPNLAARPSPALSEHSCPECGKPLTRRPAKRAGIFWWGCSGFPTCSYRAFDDNGKPQPKKP
jgi:DNA topoisomerase-3